MPLSPDEKARIRDHLGYLNQPELSTYVLGLPAGVETQFLIERAMAIGPLPEAEALVRDILCALDAVEKQRRDVLSTATIESVGGIKMRPASDGLDMCYREFVRQVGRLSNAFGITSNPFDHRGSGINFRVQ